MAERKTAARSVKSSKAQSRTTTDHDEIRRWAEERNGAPACVRGTGGKGDVGMLRIEFPGRSEAKLQQISWDEWFSKFDERGLAFLHQDRTAGGKPSRFNKLVTRETAASGRKTMRAGA